MMWRFHDDCHFLGNTKKRGQAHKRCDFMANREIEMNLIARAARRTFWTQVTFSTIGMAFSVSMLATGRDPSIYLPIFTSILFAWLPSPLQQSHDENHPGAAASPREIMSNSNPTYSPSRSMVIPLENFIGREEENAGRR